MAKWQWIQGKYIFYYDIQKYEWNNFEHIILENNLTLDESNKLEKQYISYYNSTNPSVGYNTMPGGGKSEKIQGPSDALNSFISLYYNDSNGILKKQKDFRIFTKGKVEIYTKNEIRSCLYMLQVRKRNGILVPFDKERIINAINKAFIEADGALYEDDTANDIADEIKYAVKTSDEVVSVEKIQDMVEDYLMKSERRDVAKEYIRYRYKREIARKGQDDFIKAFSAKIQGSDIENQNANVDEMSFGGRVGAASDLQMKKYALDYLVSSKSRANHENNEIYIHDLNAYAVGMHNCLSIPFDDLLAKGFNTRQTDVRPAGSVNTAFQLVAVIFQLQSLQQFGGVSATHLDWTMVPYVRKSFYKHLMDGYKYLEGIENPKSLYGQETSNSFWTQYVDIEDKDLKECHPKAYKYAMDMTEKETHQAVEGMYHNLNTLQSRSGNQLPFTSINYGTCTLPEGRMVIKALLKVSIEGLGKLHKTSIFPCGIFQCMKGVNREPGDPNYDLFRLALKSTALRLYPNYANVDWSGNAGYDKNDPKTYFSTMGKRKLQPM